MSKLHGLFVFLLAMNTAFAAPSIERKYHLKAGSFPVTGISKIVQMVYSPSGRFLATLGEYALQLWDLQAERVIHRQPVFGLTTAFAFSPDETHLAFTGLRAPAPRPRHHRELNTKAAPRPGNICYLNLRTGNYRWFQTKYLSQIVTIAFSKDGKSLFASGTRYALVEWDIPSGAATRLVRAPFYLGGAIIHPQARLCVCWPRGRRLQRTNILLYSFRRDDGGLKKRFPGHSHLSVKAAAFSPDGTFFATAGEDETVRLYNAKRNRFEFEMAVPPNLKSMKSYAKSLTFSADGSYLVGAMNNGPYAFWDSETGTLQGVLRCDDGAQAVARCPGKMDVAAVLNGIRIAFVNVRTMTTAARGSGHKSSITCSGFYKSGKSFYAADDSGCLTFHSVVDGRQLGNSFRFSGSIRTLSLSPDGGHFIIGGSLPGLYRISEPSKISALVAELPRVSVIGLSHSKSGRELAVCGGTKAGLALPRSFLLFDTKSWKSRPVPGWHWASYCSFSENSLYSACGSEIREINLKNGDVWRQFDGSDAGAVKRFQLSPDNRFLAMVSLRGELLVFERSSGKKILYLKLSDERIHCFSFMDSLLLTVSTKEGERNSTLALWNVQSEEALVTVKARGITEITSVSATGDGKRLLCGYRDGSISLWRMKQQ